jgi:hypothetical protein
MMQPLASVQQKHQQRSQQPDHCLQQQQQEKGCALQQQQHPAAWSLDVLLLLLVQHQGCPLHLLLLPLLLDPFQW